MIKVKVIEDFTLERFDELKNIVRASARNNNGYLYTGDIFECNKDMAEYLTKTNPKQRAFVEVIEIIPEVEEKVKKTKSKTTSKKILQKNK